MRQPEETDKGRACIPNHDISGKMRESLGCKKTDSLNTAPPCAKLPFAEDVSSLREYDQPKEKIYLHPIL